MTKKHTINVKFESKIAILRTVSCQKKGGPKNPGMGRPPPHHSGNARKKTFFSVDLFPKVIWLNGFIGFGAKKGSVCLYEWMDG